MVGVGMVGAAAPAIAVGIIGVGAAAPAAEGGIAGIPAPPPALPVVAPLLPAWDCTGAVGGGVSVGLPAADVADGGSELLPEAPATAAGGAVAGHGGAVHAVAAGVLSPDSEHAAIAMPASTQLTV